MGNMKRRYSVAVGASDAMEKPRLPPISDSDASSAITAYTDDLPELTYTRSAYPNLEGGGLMIVPSHLGTDDSEDETLFRAKTAASVATVVPPPRSVYTRGEIYFLVGIASVAALFSSISSPIYLPAIPTLEEHFNVTTQQINLTITMYSIFQGISPSIWCPLSDSIGRRPVYLGCIIIYIGANIGLALSNSYGMLFAFRCIQSAGIASTVAIGSGVVSDTTTRKDRGYFIGIFSGFSMMGNAFGPLIGGGISLSLGWRAIFWFLVIASSVMMLLVFFFMPETNRFIAADGSVIPKRCINRSPYIYLRRRVCGVPATYSSELETPLKKHKLDMMLSLRMFKYIDVILILVPVALHYTTWFMILTAQSTLLSEEYGFKTSQIGFSYLASGGGSIIGSMLSGRLMTRRYKSCVMAYKRANGKHADMSKFNIVRARLAPAFYPSMGLVAGTLIFGWPIQYRVHYIVPLLATALASFASVFMMNLASTLLVDLFPAESASSTACLNLTRCLICAAGLAAVDKMVNTLGAGGAFTIMGGLCAISMVCLFIELRIGMDLYSKRKNEDIA